MDSTDYKVLMEEFPDIEEKGQEENSNQERIYSLDLDHVYVGYGKSTILHDISFKVPKGSILGVIGNSGAGKSTGIRCMTAQLTPTKGIAKTIGYNVKEQEEVQIRIGYVPQLEYLSLYYDFSAIKNALFFGRHFGMDDKAIKEKCQELMGILGLGEEEFLTKPVKKLSGGERKRVSIMIGLINQPEILFLDEPTTGLDPHLRIEVLNFLLRINQKYQTTIILVSHDLECVDYCDKVIVFTDGCMVDFGSPRELTRSLPNHGKAITIQFNQLTPEDENFIEHLDEIVYLLHIGRNKFKLFIKSEQDLDVIYQKLREKEISWTKSRVESSVFLDYFRVKSSYVYEDEAKKIKENLKKN